MIVRNLWRIGNTNELLQPSKQGVVGVIAQLCRRSRFAHRS
ncbi:hypothetical protein [Nostoc sp. UHCC 0870]